MSDEQTIRARAAQALHDQLTALINQRGPEIAGEIALGSLDAIASALVGLCGTAAAAALIGRLALDISRLPIDGGRSH